MASHKGQARAKRIREFKASLGGLDDVFGAEAKRRAQRDESREAARRSKVCERKKRYQSRRDAEAAIKACEYHGTRGLRCYRCPYCDGWHLTSKPEL